MNLSFTWSLKLPVPVSLTKFGYPLISPRFHLGICTVPRFHLGVCTVAIHELGFQHLLFLSLFSVSDYCYRSKIQKDTLESPLYSSPPVADMDAVYQFVTERRKADLWKIWDCGTYLISVRYPIICYGHLRGKHCLVSFLYYAVSVFSLW